MFIFEKTLHICTTISKSHSGCIESQACCTPKRSEFFVKYFLNIAFFLKYLKENANQTPIHKSPTTILRVYAMFKNRTGLKATMG